MWSEKGKLDADLRRKKKIIHKYLLLKLAQSSQKTQKYKEKKPFKTKQPVSGVCSHTLASHTAEENSSSSQTFPLPSVSAQNTPPVQEVQLTAPWASTGKNWGHADPTQQPLHSLKDFIFTKDQLNELDMIL